jgi:DNA-binding response OmpR family regulator
MRHESATPEGGARPTLLWVDTDLTVATYSDVLETQFRVSWLHAPSTAVEFLRRTGASPEFVITEVGFADGSGYEVCRAAKNSATPSTVLVTTSLAERVPDALVAGCDAVLLKPFAPNLLLSRLARLKRARSAALQRAAVARAKSSHLRERTLDAAARIIREWPDGCCPHCGHQRAMCFEYASHRRAWYACVSCKNVWLARKRE